MSKISIIIDDGPISRAYLKLFLDENYKFQNIFYLSNFYFTKNFSIFLNSYKNNFHPLRFLKNNKLENLIEQFQSYFGFEKNFCLSMYNLNINKCFKVNHINSNNINSINVLSELDKFENTLYLNTTKQILKKKILSKYQFIHIHPGYLPNIRGMDGSLWNYFIRSKFGVSSFVMAEGIDTGKIILREELEKKEFNFPIYKSLKAEELRRIWYSFFDPLLRAYHLKKLIKKTNFFQFIEFDKNYYKDKSVYYKNIDQDTQSIVFDKVFRK